MYFLVQTILVNQLLLKVLPRYYFVRTRVFYPVEYVNHVEDLPSRTVKSILVKDKKNISIEQIRDFIRVLNMSSFAGGYKIGVVKHAELLSTEAANALLKTLEEPKEKSRRPYL